ncbi:MAG TPA: M90 family metallopeptidase [Gemmatimonadaceae bacterium]|nr:M90 family metallopeptidase [Gemmatimonadaceae bacterium]
MFGSKRRRRRRLRQLPPPPWWDQLIASVPLLRTLPQEDRRELAGHVRVFLDEKVFEGCGGLHLTDEMQRIIAAQACVLLLRRETDYFPALRAILVYPSAYRAPVSEERGGVVEEREESRLGESWERGVVVLAWDEIRADLVDPEVGHNLVLHEFAHQLDDEDGLADGTPTLSGRDAYRAWMDAFERAYTALRQRGADRDGVLDAYGAESPAEFFAVAVEAFFTNPQRMLERHAPLYDSLQAYFAQDPAHWG